MFTGLAEKLQNTLRKLRGKGKLNEQDVNEALREVRLALLEADVNFKVVKDFIGRIKERAVGQEVLTSLTPGQQVIKIVHEELTSLMGGTQSRLTAAAKPPTVLLLVGLQGAGKTTTAGKLAHLLQQQQKRPLLAAADVYRPAAVQQLQVVGEQLAVPVFAMGQKTDPVDIAAAAVEHARAHGCDYVIIDTAGRLHINVELMDELKAIKTAVRPQEILLVLDAMTGQDAVNAAASFNTALGVDGVILTKLDGDARGGAALSVKAVTGCPIKFVGVGEKMAALEPFFPERMASRILGMGDVLSLIEKAEHAFDREKAQALEKKLRKDEFTLDDFLEQMQQMRNMGPLEQILGMLPGAGKLKNLPQAAVSEQDFKRLEAVIQSMTREERRNPAIIDGSRRKRIARGSGSRVQDVNRLLKQFAEAKKMLKKLGTMQKDGRKGPFKLPFMP